MELVKRLMAELVALAEAEESLSGDDIGGLIELTEGEQVEWVSSGGSEDTLINIFRVIEGEGRDSFIGTVHVEGGVVSSVDGPWSTIDEAKENYDPVDDDWTDF